MRVLKNAVFLSLMQVSNVLLGLLVMPYVTGVLGSDRLGISSFGLAASMYCAMLGQLGIHIYGIRRVAQSRSDGETLQQAFSECLAYQAFFSAIALVIYNAWALAQSDGNVGYYVLFNLTVLGYASDISWLFGGLERYDIVAVRTFLMRSAGALLVFVFVRSAEDLGAYILVQQGTLLASNLFFWLGLRRYGLRPRMAAVWASVKSIVKQSFWLFLPSFFAIITTSVDKLLLGYLTSKREVALYDYPMRLFKVGSTIVGVAGNVMLPRLARFLDAGKIGMYHKELYELSHFGMLLGMLIAGGMMVTANEVCGFLLGDSFVGADGVLRIAVVPLTVSGMGIYFAALATGKEREVVAGIATACIVSVVGYLLLIPRYGARGAALAYAAPEFLVQCYYVWLMRKHLMWKRLSIHIISSSLLLLAAVTIALQVGWGGSLVSFLLKGSLFVCVFLGGVMAVQSYTRKFVVNTVRRGAMALKRKGGH